MPPPPPPGADAQSICGWDLLYPAQAVDGLVHLQGGEELRTALRCAAPVLETRDSGEHLRCRVGEAVLTSGVDGTGSSGPSGLPFDAIVHTVPPFWPRGTDASDPTARMEWSKALLSCYRSSFRLAAEFASDVDRSGTAAGLAIATPVLGSGARGAPFAHAARVLAEAAAQALVDMPTSLRVVVHSSSLGRSDVAVVEAELAAAAAAAAASEAASAAS